MPVNGSIQLYLNLSETLQNPSLALLVESITRSVNEGATATQLTDGSGANQVSKLYCLSESLAATTRTLDLTNLTATVGGTVTTVSFTKLKLIYGINNSTTEGQFLLMGGGGANPFFPFWSASTVKEKLMPMGSPFLKTNFGAQSSNPWTVDSSNQHFLLDSGAWTIPYKLILLGV